VALIAVGLAGLLLLNTAVNSNSFQLHAQQQRQKALDTKEAELSRDVDNLGTPTQLDTAARGLGLVPAGTSGFINAKTGEVTGKPVPASGAGAAQ
jgi:hypothetical protein